MIGATDLEVMEKINEAQKEFSLNAHVLTKEGYVVVTPLFDLRTHFAVNVTIVGGTNALAATDVVICATDADDQTGTQAATALQTAIQAAITAASGTPSLTVSWSTSAWKFTIDTINGTSITLAAPSGIRYTSALDLLGFTADTTSDTSVTGEIPQDCTLESALPDDFESLATDPYWNGYRIFNGPLEMFKSPRTFGIPQWYHIRNKKIMLYPCPTSQGMLHIYYKYSPTEFTAVAGYQECGLSGIALDSDTGLTAATAYTFQVNIDGGGLVNYTITTGTDTTFEAVIDLMNDQLKGAKFTLEEGDLRCTSNNVLTSSSAIALAAGTGTDLFATLTGWTAFDTAVASQAGTDLYVDDVYAMAVVYFAASQIAEENLEQKIADRYYAQFRRKVEQFTVHRANNNPQVFPQAENRRPFPEVDLGD